MKKTIATALLVLGLAAPASAQTEVSNAEGVIGAGIAMIAASTFGTCDGGETIFHHGDVGCMASFGIGFGVNPFGKTKGPTQGEYERFLARPDVADLLTRINGEGIPPASLTDDTQIAAWQTDDIDRATADLDRLAHDDLMRPNPIRKGLFYGGIAAIVAGFIWKEFEKDAPVEVEAGPGRWGVRSSVSWK